MRKQTRFQQAHIAIICSSLLLSILSSMTLNAQSPINFSGKWEFDKDKSTPGKLDSQFEGALIRSITQTSSKLSYRDIYLRTGSKEWSTTDEVYLLDGREHAKKTGTATSRKTAQWSDDKKILTLTYKETYMEEGVARELHMADMYKLSDDGKSLIIETYSRNHVTGESRTTSVYHKK